MEALVLIFAEILIACMVPVFAMAGALAATVLEAVLALLALIFGGVFEVWRDNRSAARKAGGAVAPKAPRKPLIPRKVIHWAAGILVTVGAIAVLASFLFMQPILRYVLDTASAKAGAEISFERAEGTLLTGDVALYGVKAMREDPEGLGFDMAIAEIEAEVDVMSLLGRTPMISLARVEGVTGSVSPPKADPDKPREKKTKRPFIISTVDVKKVDVEIHPKDSASYSLMIETAEVAPFRSSIALFSLLFRSNMVAEIAGQTLRVETNRITETGRETRWSFENVEADKMKLLVPKAPLNWLSDGRVTVQVVDRWSLSDDWIDMDWRITLEDVAVQVPRAAGTTEKLLGGALAKVVNKQGGNVDFQYRLVLDKDDIETLRSGDLDRFWNTVLSGFLKDGARNVMEDEQAVDAQQVQDDADNEDKPGALDKLKGLFKKDTAE